jgi:hypothetical protein
METKVVKETRRKQIDGENKKGIIEEVEDIRDRG